jgi:acetate kinase
MRVLIANLGSTSFKFKLIDTERNGEVVARGAHERIGQSGGQFATHGDVIDVILKELPAPPDAIGFKAVHGGPISGAVRVTPEVIATMEDFADVAPAHNPCYVAAMKAFAQKLPAVPQVAAFETAFHQTIPMSRQVYAIPWEWTQKLGIRRYGFHGASHRYIAARTAELLGKEKSRRVISCHLGGSCSVTAILDGKSVAHSFGLTPQTGLMQNNRVGDFDIFAMQRLQHHGMGIDEVLKKLGKEGGLLGISGVSNDMRDVEKAAAEGNERARLAVDAFVEGVRGFIGSYMVVLGGCDAIVFTAGIGENGTAIREAVCHNLQWAGIELDLTKNKARCVEQCISSDKSKVQVWIVPTNEELIVAHQTAEVLSSGFATGAAV